MTESDKMKEMLETLDKLCRFKSVAELTGDPTAPYGKQVNEALKFALSTCESFGMRVKNCNNQLGWAEIGEGAEIVGIPVHLDVVPAGDGWKTDPYSATVIDGTIYGRGVCDDKGPAVACIYAMRDILESKTPLKRRVRLIFGQTEENGDWTDMEYYREHEEIPAFGFTPDGDFPAIYGEKGILTLKLSMPIEKSGLLSASGGNAPNMVADFAEAKFAKGVGFSVVGKSAHGSTPELGENAISRLFALSELSDCPFARFYNEKIGTHLHGEAIGADFSDEKSGRLIFNVGLLGSDAESVFIVVNLRTPVDFDYPEIEAAISRECAPCGVTVEHLSWQAPIYLDKDGEPVKTLVNVYRECTGDDSCAKVIGGGTYARAMDNIVAFGPMFPELEPTEHQPNECYLAEKFMQLREIYRKAIEQLANL